MNKLSRRDFVKTAALGAASAALLAKVPSAEGAEPVPAPKPSPPPMPQPFSVKPLPYPYDALKGISEQTNKYHHDTHYVGYVKKANEIEGKLPQADRSAANANFSEFGELKRRETFNANGMILHELYWDVLGGDGQPGSQPLITKLADDFGSFDAWRADFAASAKAALGWAILAWDPRDGKLRNFTGDTHNQGGVWGAIPLIPIDVFEHAYYHDQGPNRAAYIEAFLSNIDWNKVNAIYESRVQSPESRV